MKKIYRENPSETDKMKLKTAGPANGADGSTSTELSSVIVIS